MLQYLPPELISYIGTFLSLNEQRVCIETSKCFTSIAHTSPTEELRLVLHDANYDKLEYLDKIYAYVHKVLPCVSQFIIDFNNITNITFQRIPYVPDKLVLEIHSCDTPIQKKILELFPDDIEIRIQNYEKIVTNIEYLRKKTNITEFSTGISDTNMWILKDPLITRCKNLDIYTNMGNTFIMPVDFSDIDITRNKNLTLHFRQSNMTSLFVSYPACVDAYKITRIVDWNTNSSLLNFFNTPFTRFIESVTSDEEFHKKTRIKEIHFSYRNKYNYMDLTKFVNAFPKNIVYSITPSTSECFSIIEELYQNGIQNVNILYYSRYLYLNAIVCKDIASKIMKDRCIELHNLNYTKNNDDITTSKEAFDAMYSEDKRYWTPFMKLLDMI